MLRYYQQTAYDSILEELQSHRSTMAVMATGLGKTRLFAAVAKHWPGRVLVLAHRSELVSQAAETLQELCGVPVGIEQASRKAGPARIVVASVQTITQKRRLANFPPDTFDLVIVDEVHRYLAKTYRRVLDHFVSAKVLGVTATPDRSDKQGLKPIMESVACNIDIRSGVEIGYLVPLSIGRVNIQGIDISGVGKVAGDLQESKLEEVMLKNVGAVVEKTLELHPNRQGIFFFPGVESAELAATKLNAHQPGCAVFIDGKTDKEERAEKVAGFRNGKYRYLTNCNVATEGFDAPLASMVVVARPTLSRSLYAQMVGRGTRVVQDAVAGLEGEENAGERRASIAWSDKPNCIVLDFVGNSGKHDLACAVDLMGGDYTPEERKLAKKEMEELDGGDPADPDELLANARRKLEAQQRIIEAAQFTVDAVVEYIDPFTALNVDMAKIEAQELKMGRFPLSAGAADVLRNFGVPAETVAGMSKLQGDDMMRKLFNRKKYGMATLQQLTTLKRWGIKTTRVYKRQATEALGYLDGCKRTGQAVNTEQLVAIATGA